MMRASSWIYQHGAGLPDMNAPVAVEDGLGVEKDIIIEVDLEWVHKLRQSQ